MHSETNGSSASPATISAAATGPGGVATASANPPMTSVHGAPVVAGNPLLMQAGGMPPRPPPMMGHAPPPPQFAAAAAMGMPGMGMPPMGFARPPMTNPGKINHSYIYHFDFIDAKRTSNIGICSYGMGIYD